MKLQGKKIVVVGLGKTGVALSRFLTGQGARVTVTDQAQEKDLVDAIDEIRPMGVNMQLGGHHEKAFETCDLVVISPGVPMTLPHLKYAQDRGVPVIGEIELASRFISEPMIAVTGTNGKTTTTTMIGHMLKHSGLSVFVGGNIGTPLISYLESPEKADVILIEISSFQLDTIKTFRPSIGAFLNVSRDHMDRYESFDHYLKSKLRIFENQTSEDAAIINASDPHLYSACNDICSKKWFFGSVETPFDATGNYLQMDVNTKKATFFGVDGRRSLFDLTQMHLKGRHNLENASAAIMTSIAAGASHKIIQKVLNEFKGLPHRMETIRTLNGIQFVNDSKATNVDATIKAIESFTKPLILIMGGRDKEDDFSTLKNALENRVKLILLMGEAKHNILKQLQGASSIKLVDSMDKAVFTAFNRAKPGDVVLLAPACASFDMFDSYAHRGDVFRKAVLRLN
jgi:UDP-N-acetylmuramoylalanine--D-glutamate ligase